MALEVSQGASPWGVWLSAACKVARRLCFPNCVMHPAPNEQGTPAHCRRQSGGNGAAQLLIAGKSAAQPVRER